MRLKSLLILIFGRRRPSLRAVQGRIQGVVQDSQGAVVEGATVPSPSTETNISKITETDSNGIYNFLSLCVGPLCDHRRKAGFKKKRLKMLWLRQSKPTPSTSIWKWARSRNP